MTRLTTTPASGSSQGAGGKQAGTQVSRDAAPAGPREEAGTQKKTRTTRTAAKTTTRKTATRTAAKTAAKPRRVRPTTAPIPMLGCDVPLDYTTMVQYATTLSRATVGVPPELQGSAENIVAVMMIARSLQLPLGTVLQSVFLTRTGEVGQRSRLLHQLARRAGHRLEVDHCDDTLCEGVLWLHDRRQPIEVSYTIIEAQQLGLTESWRDPDRHWERQPANMLRNRWITRAVDWHCPEVKQGADFNPDGLLRIDGLGEEELVVTGLGPEITRVLNQADEAERMSDPGQRYARLRGLWTEARLLTDTVIDEQGGTLGGVLASRLTAARAAAQLPDDDPAQGEGQEQEGGMSKARRLLEHSRAAHAAATAAAGDGTDRDAGAETAGGQAGELPCGCPMAVVTATGAHAQGCPEPAATAGPEGAR